MMDRCSQYQHFMDHSLCSAIMIPSFTNIHTHNNFLVKNHFNFN